MIIEAWQHLYGNVEKALSPSRVGGFQTLFYSQDYINEQELTEIETRLVYYPSDLLPEKLAFFNLGNNKYVISRIVHVEQKDRFGRGGNYLAHSLIISRADFIKLKYNPFVLFHLFNNRFINLPTEALSMEGRSGVNIGKVDIKVDDAMGKSTELHGQQYALKWERSELWKLLHLTHNNSELKRDRVSLALTGTAEDVRDALAMVFSLALESDRPDMSFDTYFDKCNPVVSYFWANGYAAAPSPSPRLIFVDCAKCKVDSDVSIPVTPYEKWLSYKINQSGYADIINNKSAAFEANNFLTGIAYDSDVINNMPPDLTDEFTNQNWPAIEAISSTKLEALIGRRLAGRILNPLLMQYRSAGTNNLFIAINRGFDRGPIANMLLNTFLNERPAQDYIADIEKFLKTVKHVNLEILVLIWKRDYGALRRLLESMHPEQYKNVITLFAGTDLIPIEKLLVPSMTAVLSQTTIELSYINPRLKEQIPDVVLQVIKLQQFAELATFIPVLPQMDTKNLANILKSLGGSEKLAPPDFITKLDQILSSRTDAINPQSSVRNIINKFALKDKDDKKDTRKNH